MRQDATHLGTVEDVTGTTVRVRLSDSIASGLSFVRGQPYRVGQVGGFVRFPLGFCDLYGVISQVGASAAPDIGAIGLDSKWLQVHLVGEGRPGKGFDRGVSQYPTIGDAAHVVTESDLRVIYTRGEERRYVQIGHLAAAESIPARIDIDAMVTRHSVVVGATGSGKSTTVASLLASLSNRKAYPSARVLVIDVHGEYGAALRDRASVFRVNPNKKHNEKPLHIPYWAMNLEELFRITVGTPDATGRAALINTIMTLKRKVVKSREMAGMTEDAITPDSPIPFSIHRLWFELHCEMHATHLADPGKEQSKKTWALLKKGNAIVQKGDAMKVIPPRFRSTKDVRDDPEKIRFSKSRLNLQREIDRLASRLRDPRLSFLFRPGPYLPNLDGNTKGDLDDLLLDWVGGDEPITILDLSGIVPTIQSEVVGTLLRVVYDALFWARNLPEGGRQRPLLIVLEEAHAYLGAEVEGGAASAIRRIAKEGRKYGIGIMLVSQRPSDIDSGILSQCGTIFGLRLSNGADRSHVRTAASDGLEGLFSTLPVLRTGEAIVVGEAVSIPMRVLVDTPSPDRRPDSADPAVVVKGDEADGYEGPGGWNQTRIAPDYREVVELWRRQDARPTEVYGNHNKERVMERRTVESSNIAAIGYDEATRTLEVEFRRGQTYRYFDVPSHVHAALMRAESHGSYFSRNVRKNFRYARI